MQTRGFGTEKIEDEVSLIFPEAKVARMDLDTTRSRKSYERIIADFELKKIDILIGTQMITKGLDFDKVSLVGILNADNMLNFPDFRAFERSYQLMVQVSGRAGRKEKQGNVIIQTTMPEHFVINDIINTNYEHLFNTLIGERHQFKYPPFYRLIQLTLKHKDLKILNAASDRLAKNLKQKLSNRVLGPEFPVINKIQNYYLKNILLKIEKENFSQKFRNYLIQHIDLIKSENNNKMLQIVIDVDNM
jgi:primosomal protein N' (replication factor Y)